MSRLRDAFAAIGIGLVLQQGAAAQDTVNTNPSSYHPGNTAINNANINNPSNDYHKLPEPIRRELVSHYACSEAGQIPETTSCNEESVAFLHMDETRDLDRSELRKFAMDFMYKIDDLELSGEIGKSTADRAREIVDSDFGRIMESRGFEHNGFANDPRGGPNHVSNTYNISNTNSAANADTNNVYTGDVATVENDAPETSAPRPPSP